MGRKPKEKSLSRGKAAKPVAPIYHFQVDAYLIKGNPQMPDDSQRKEDFIKIKLPCSLAELTSEIANATFSACEELAFKAGIKFIEEKPLDVCICPTEANPNCTIHGIKDEDIPF